MRCPRAVAGALPADAARWWQRIMTVLGEGDFAYQVLDHWEVLPRGWELGDIAGVAVDSHDRVYVFNRGEHPMLVFNHEGHFLTSWGEARFSHPHGICMAPDDTLYCTDTGERLVSHCTLSGKVLDLIAIPGDPQPSAAGDPVHHCAHVAVSPAGEIYIADGCGNARVHKLASDGRLLGSWGESGCEAGQFNVPHNLCCDSDGWVYVADRENHRIQVFDRNGRFEAQWHNLHRPSALCMTPGRDPVVFVGEIGPELDANRGLPNLGPRVTILDQRGHRIGRLAGSPAAGTAPGQFLAPHAVAVDSRGDLYVGEASGAAWFGLFPRTRIPKPLRRLQKFVHQRRQ